MTDWELPLHYPADRQCCKDADLVRTKSWSEQHSGLIHKWSGYFRRLFFHSASGRYLQSSTSTEKDITFTLTVEVHSNSFSQMPHGDTFIFLSLKRKIILCQKCNDSRMWIFDSKGGDVTVRLRPVGIILTGPEMHTVIWPMSPGL